MSDMSPKIPKRVTQQVLNITLDLLRLGPEPDLTREELEQTLREAGCEIEGATEEDAL
jgi:hypothetical protein